MSIGLLMKKKIILFLSTFLFYTGSILALTNEELASRSREYVQRLCDEDKFSGAVLIAQGKEVLFTQACGEASKRFHILNKVDTKFSLGSMNKMFTAVAIAQLEQRGLLSYDDRISKYIDESWLPKDIADTITVRHLLTHSSGLGSYFNDKFRTSSRGAMRTIEAFKPFVQGDVPQFEPGSKFLYSNTGILLLGVVIEKVSRQDYFDYIAENIYRVAGMSDTDSYELDKPVENLATGYMPAEGGSAGWQSNVLKKPARGGPAGGGYSTVEDLHRFALAMLDDKLISRTSRETIWSAGVVPYYGYGFMRGSTPAGELVGHGGHFPGVSALMYIYPDAGYVVVVLSNYSKAKARPVWEKIDSFLH